MDETSKNVGTFVGIFLRLDAESIIPCGFQEVSMFLGKRPKPAQSTTARGQQAEDAALAHLQARGLKLVERNYRTPGRGGGEIDLILRDRDGSLVFVEVRSRNTERFGGAGGSIGRLKQQRIVLAARHYLMRLAAAPPCRFDVVLVDSSGNQMRIEWLQAAFEAL